MGRPEEDAGWRLLGTVDIREPGLYEIVSSGGAMGIRQAASVDAPMVVRVGEVAHPCRPCTCCGGCACLHHYGGRSLCRDCAAYRAWAIATEPLLERYLAAAAHGEGFVLTDSRTHTPGCPSLTDSIYTAIRALEEGCTHLPFREVRVHEVRSQAPDRKRCAVCCPVTRPTSRSPRYPAPSMPRTVSARGDDARQQQGPK